MRGKEAESDGSTAQGSSNKQETFNKGGARGVPAQLTDDEKYAYYNVSGSPGAPGQIEAVPSRGGYLVSPEQIKTLQEYRSAYVALKDYVTVMTAGSSYGRWPTLPDQAIEFTPLVELTDIDEGEISFSELEYKIKDYAFVIPASNQLLEDADVSLIDIIGRTLAKGAVRTENKKILEPLTTLISSAPSIKDYKALNTALYKTLDGVFEPTAKVFVNQDSFVWLANLEDANKRPLMLPDVTAPNKYLYRGKEIVVVPNSVLPNIENGSVTLATECEIEVKIDDPRTRRIMKARYIRAESWATIAADCHLSQRQVLRLHRNGVYLLSSR